MENNYCPICGEENHCLAGTVEHGNCWCDQEGGFPEGILELVPKESRRKHCICKNCLDKFRKEAELKKNR